MKTMIQTFCAIVTRISFSAMDGCVEGAIIHHNFFNILIIFLLEEKLFYKIKGAKQGSEPNS